MALEDSNNMVMPVSPMYGGGNGGFGGFGGDWGWIILLLLCGWGGGGFGGFGGGYGNMMLGYDFPWLLNGQNNINANTNSGFRDAMLNDGIGNIQNSIASGFGDVQTALCGGFAGVNASINGAQNALAQQMYANQIADLERSFAAQTASTQGMNTIAMNLQNCCCENRANIADLKYTVATENCADRTAAYQNTRDIIDNQNRNGQAILDKLCQLELDGVKAQVDAKNDRIAELTTQLNMANLNASQVAQTAQIIDGTYRRLADCPVSSTPVYGRQPIFTCSQNVAGSGCGCSGNTFYN
jgi:hypothetical protein